jgi:hypothetical protein
VTPGSDDGVSSAGTDDITPAGSAPAADDSGRESPHAVSSTLLADAIGGPRGMLDTGIPAVVFVIVNAATSLTPAIFAALGFGVLLLAIRLVRRQPIQQALAGFIGIGIAAFVAHRTHSAKGFFLPGILSQAALTIVAIVSLVIRKPYIGYVMGAIDARFAHWRESPRLLRAMNQATLIWGFVFLFRTVVQGLLYLANRPGWLAAVQLAQGWPLFAAALAATYALCRRATHAEQAEQAADSEPLTSESLTR